MDVDIEDVSETDDIAIAEDSELSAVATVELQLDCSRGRGCEGSPCAPPRAYKTPSSRFGEHESIKLFMTPDVINPQGRAAATSMTEVCAFALEKLGCLWLTGRSHYLFHGQNPSKAISG